MTEILYMGDIESNYIREFEARVVERGFDYVTLDRTAFYAVGGGQPSDTGTLSWDGGSIQVREVTKKGVVKHHLAQDPETVPDDVTGALDWERRYAHMRMHTAQHIISGVVYDFYGGRTVGNQIYNDRSRIDFAPVTFTDDMMADVQAKCNEIFTKDTKVEITTVTRDALEREVDAQRANLDLLPRSVRELRVVTIGDFDVCPCAGTHVRALGEIGTLRITKKDRKGKDRDRITYELDV